MCSHVAEPHLQQCLTCGGIALTVLVVLLQSVTLQMHLYVYCTYVFSRPALKKKKKNAIHREMKQMCISSPFFLFFVCVFYQERNSH